MFNKLKIENFRGIKNLEIKDLNKINIFVGENGIGKTTILDALYVSINPNNALLSFKTNLFRRIDDATNNPNFWQTFFYNFSEENRIKLSLSNKSQKNKRCRRCKIWRCKSRIRKSRICRNNLNN